MSTNFPSSLDVHNGSNGVGGDSVPASATALDSSVAHPTHANLHENTGDAIQAIEAKVGTGASTPAANKVLISSGTGASTWSTVTADMMTSGTSPTFGTVVATDMTLGGFNLGEIETFTPSWTNASGFETNAGYYARLKDLVAVFIEAEFNASVSVSSTVKVDLPIAGAGTYPAANAMMQVQLCDLSGAFKFYQGMATPVDTNTIEIRYNIVDGNEIYGQPVSGTAPFTWADGDKIIITGLYRTGS